MTNINLELNIELPYPVAFKDVSKYSLDNIFFIQKDERISQR